MISYSGAPPAPTQHRSVLRKGPEPVLDRAGTPAPHLTAAASRTAPPRRVVHNPVRISSRDTKSIHIFRLSHRHIYTKHHFL